MTIPLDNLYDYIFSLTGQTNKNLRMYRFSPHGSKNIKNLITHNNAGNLSVTDPQSGIMHQSWHQKLLFCYDQEPLDFNYYSNNTDDVKNTFVESSNTNFTGSDPLSEKIFEKQNLSAHRTVPYSIYDFKLLLHSEKNSEDLKKYEKNGFLGIYYWAHAFIALDWYRFARHDIKLKSLQKENFNNDFNIYCRAWDGSREYRLTFLSLLKKNNIDNLSNIFFNETCNNIHYSEYEPENKKWEFKKTSIDNIRFCTFRNIDSSASATYNPDDYNDAAIDIVLETVFDKRKIQLTEKLLRPIACGKPFILVAEHGSLEYIKSYGFKTFGNLIDENYDSITDPRKRLESITKTMNLISSLGQQEKNNLFLEMHKIADYNKNWFFSDDFFNIINSELKNNLENAFEKLDDPVYQTAKEIRTIFRAYKMYKKYLPQENQKDISLFLQDCKKRIELSKKTIGKY